MKRADAYRLLDTVRTMLAERASPEAIEAALSRDFQLVPLERCDGDAHSNAHVDNCALCAPRWGWIGPFVKVT